MERAERAEWADLKMMTVRLTYVALVSYIEVCKRQCKSAKSTQKDYVQSDRCNENKTQNANAEQWC